MSAKEDWLNKNTNKYSCPHCGKEYSKKGISSHIWRKHTEIGRKFKTPSRKGEKAWNKGLTKENDDRVKRYSEKSASSRKGNNYEIGFCSKESREFQSSIEGRKEQSERMKEVVIKNPQSYSANNVSGRVKTFSKTYFGLEMKFKGTWELEVANKLYENNIKFTNIIKPIEYFWKESGKNHLYFPDFYLEDYDLYIEVKGYERERDLDKWASIDNLVVLKEKEIKEIKNGISIKNFL